MVHELKEVRQSLDAEHTLHREGRDQRILLTLLTVAYVTQQLICSISRMSITYVVLLSKVLNQTRLINPHKNLPRRRERIHFFL